MSTALLSSAQHILAARQQLAPCLAQTPNPASFIAQINVVITHLLAACEQNSHVALAMIQLDLNDPYTVRHPINVAIVVNLALKNLGHSETERWHFIAAALTMNIGMYALQNELSQQSSALTPEQLSQIKLHPAQGREALRSLGVADSMWLDCVLQHHEAPDGSGYPQQLAGDAVLFAARLIGLADRYCALLSNSTYRTSQSADVALQTSLNSAGGSLDQKLVNLFSQTIGSYPPGSVVLLNNGESGVVLEQAIGAAAPHILALFDRDDQLYPQAIRRNGQLAEFRILKVLDSRIIAGAMSLSQIWGPDAQI
ncbi:HD-GYP domain-containing protein [Deefgea salmonis]|uniref:HD-GYP domain-containing protein n=1 Tax=Deefgea salmonis TaxID=2875502 RepID=A0ABS8BKM0_9NEIS|nr:HD domain-containing phosphohydrolase [Deefgea salmonis]MCB5196154.1 hypothetical protein [Deefgea salmonis]